jgi:hypothetical protein
MFFFALSSGKMSKLLAAARQPCVTSDEKEHPMEFMLMMRGDHAAWSSQSPAEHQRIMELYYAYVQRLKDEGRFVAGSALSSKSKRLLPGLKVIDGPYPEAKEALNGYFLIRAKDFDEALALARDCPCLTHGETVEVIELSSH